MTNLGQKISSLRKTQGMTQKDLALLLHVSDKVVSKWENGQSEPDISTLKEIAKVFCVSVSNLLEEPEIPKKDWNSRLFNFFKRNYMIIIQIILSYCALLTFEIGIGYILGFNLILRYVPLWATLILICFCFVICVLQSVIAFFDKGSKTITILKFSLLAFYSAMIIASFVLLSRPAVGSFDDLTIVTGVGFSILLIAELLNCIVDVNVIKTKAPVKLGKIASILIIVFLGIQIGFTAGNIAVISVAVENEVVKEEYRRLTPSSISFTEPGDACLYNIGDTLQLDIIYYPSYARKDPIYYSSSDTSILLVDQNGLVTAREYGIATIYAELGDRIKVTKTITISPLKITSATTQTFLENSINTVILPVDNLDKYKTEDRLKFYVTKSAGSAPATDIEISNIQFYDDYISLDILLPSITSPFGYETVYLYMEDMQGWRPITSWVNFTVIKN